MALPTHPLLVTLQIPLLYMTNCITLAVSPRRQVLRVGLSLPIVILLISQSLHRAWEGRWGNHYALNCVVFSIAFTYVDWILLASPDEEVWFKIRYGKSVEGGERKQSVRAKGNGNGNGHPVTSSKGNDRVPRIFWARLWWGMRLATTNRYVGWSCEVKNVRIEVNPEYPRL